VRRWLSGVLSGLAIEAVVLLLAPLWHWATYIRDGDWALDGMMRSIASLSALPAGDSSHVPNLVFIDVDERTWRSAEWGGGEPARSPRPQLLALINQAFSRGAQYIVLDILVEGPPSDEENNQFATGLQALMPSWRPRESDSVHPAKRLILVRSLRPPLTRQGVSWDALPEIRPSAVDRVVASSDGLIVSASPYFVQSSDGVLREWSLWRVACQLSRNNSPDQAVTLPSVQMLIAAWAGGGADDRGAPWRRPQFRRCPPADDTRAIEDAKKAISDETLRWVERHVGIANLGTETTASDIVSVEEERDEAPLVNHIVFRLFDRAENRAPSLPSGGLSFSRIPASSVLAVQPSSATPWSRLLPGAIVIIGQSNSGASDTFVTPLGRMSGALVILNSVDSILRYGFLRTAPELALRIPISILFVLASSALLVWWRGITATLFSGVLVMACSLAISLLCFIRWGVWFDFTAPLVGTLIGVVWEISHARHEHEGAARDLAVPSGAHIASASKQTTRH
jgi:CHASE2 domain-containing sensor protein